MPKLQGTRKIRAADLLARAKRGPSFLGFTFTQAEREEIEHRYKIWAETWIIPELEALIPELKNKKEN